MSKFHSWINKDDSLNLQVKSHADQKKLKKIRKTLLSLTEMDIKASNSYNVITIKKDENGNKKNYQEDLEQIKQNDVDIVNIISLDPTKQVDSSDFENENEEC